LVPFTQILASGRKSKRAVQHATKDDLAFIMYTSGTTNMPKGVLLRHGNLQATVSSVTRFVNPIIGDGLQRHMSFLPLSHIFEQAVHQVMLARGGYIGYFGQSTPKKIKDDWCAVRPTMIVGVPRVFDAMLKTSNEKKKNSWMAWGIGKIPVGGPWVGRKILGWDKCKLVVSGSAPLNPNTGAWLKKVLYSPKTTRHLLEGFAMTETAALGFASTPGDNNLGHCGVPFDMVEVRLQSEPGFECLAEDYIVVDGKKVACPRGEIQLRGPGNMKGYFKNDQATKETLTSDGWLMTGDLARINPNGTISIIGRKKNKFKLANGEYISVENLEGIYGKASSVEQIWVYGNSYKNAVVAVVTPSSKWAKSELKVAGKWPAGKDQDPTSAAFRAKFHKVCTANRDWLTKKVWENIQAEADVSTLVKHEKLPTKGDNKKPCIPIVLETEIDDMGTGFNVANGCLTPTFKLRRKNLKKHYMKKLKALYTSMAMAPKAGEKW